MLYVHSQSYQSPLFNLLPALDNYFLDKFGVRFSDALNSFKDGERRTDSSMFRELAGRGDLHLLFCKMFPACKRSAEDDLSPPPTRPIQPTFNRYTHLNSPHQAILLLLFTTKIRSYYSSSSNAQHCLGITSTKITFFHVTSNIMFCRLARGGEPDPLAHETGPAHDEILVVPFMLPSTRSVVLSFTPTFYSQWCWPKTIKTNLI